jgi:ribosomal protein L11 methyltransferase
MTPLPPHPASKLARLTTDEASARRLSETMAEMLPADEVAISAFELDEAKRLWAVEFVFEQPPDEAAFRALLETQADTTSLIFDTLHAKDWVAASLEGLAPVSAGRFLIHGAHDRARVPVNCIDIEIEAALAFGTGHHGTTRGCLLAFEDVLKRRKSKLRHPEVRAKRASKGVGRHPSRRALRRAPQDDGVLDIGTGTGVLAIAAARALRWNVLGSDIDPIAVRVARENARRNRAGSLVSLFTAAGASAGRFRSSGKHGLIFANILAGPLKRMAAPVAKLLAPGGIVILSGLLPAHANAVIAAYRIQGLNLRRRYSLNGWVTLAMQRGRC